MRAGAALDGDDPGECSRRAGSGSQGECGGAAVCGQARGLHGREYLLGAARIGLDR